MAGKKKKGTKRHLLTERKKEFARKEVANAGGDQWEEGGGVSKMENLHSVERETWGTDRHQIFQTDGKKKKGRLQKKAMGDRNVGGLVGKKKKKQHRKSGGGKDDFQNGGRGGLKRRRGGETWRSDHVCWG